MWCPVDLSDGVAMQPMRGAYYPAHHKGLVYCMSTHKNRLKFMANPLKYISQDLPPPALALRVAVVGPPNSGKTFLANRLCADYGCKYITIESAIQELIETNPESALARAVEKHTKSAQVVPHALCIKALKKALLSADARINGYVIDGHPFTIEEAQLFEDESIVPCKIIELELGETQCVERAKIEREVQEHYPDNEQLAERRNFCLEHMPKIRAYCNNMRRNWDSVDASRSKWWVSDRVQAYVQQQHRQLQQYWQKLVLGRPAQVFGTCLSSAEVERRICQFKEFCPVTLIRDGRLVRTPLHDLDFSVEYKAKFYKMNDAGTLSAFVADPDAYCAGELPELLPSRRTALEVRNAFPAQLQFGGFCPVTYVQGGSTYESLKPGLLDFAVEYDGQLYGLRNVEAVTEFMELPARYHNVVLPKKVPPPVKPMVVNELPLLGYLEQTVALTVTKSLTATGLKKPKYPFLTTDESAMIHMALHLKSINPRASEYSRSVYRKKLRKFEDKSNLVRYLGKSMDAQHTANRPLGFDGKLSEFLDMKDEGASVFGT